MDAAARPAGSLVPRAMRVRRTVPEAGEAATLELSAGHLAFAPGQFVMVSVPGIGEVPISIAGDPQEPATLALTVRAVGPVTEALVRARPGDWLGVRGPYGTSWPIGAAAGGHLLVIAGGLGLAAVRAALLGALGERERYARLVLLYGTRDPSVILYADELAAWAREGVDVRVTVDSAPPGWTGEVGLVTALLARLTLEPARTTALVCGPEVMMRFCVRDLVLAGVSPSRVHLSLERHMDCGTAQCGRCQLGPFLLCRDGPVLPAAAVNRALAVPEL